MPDLYTLVYAETVPSYVVRWEKRIINMDWIDAAKLYNVIKQDITKRISYLNQ